MFPCFNYTVLVWFGLRLEFGFIFRFVRKKECIQNLELRPSLFLCILRFSILIFPKQFYCNPDSDIHTVRISLSLSLP